VTAESVSQLQRKRRRWRDRQDSKQLVDGLLSRQTDRWWRHCSAPALTKTREADRVTAGERGARVDSY
jgi:hypothetical protein